MSKKAALTRVEWQELRRVPGGGRELFRVIAEGGPDKLSFFERRTWETRWYEIPATPRRIAKAQRILAGRTTSAG